MEKGIGEEKFKMEAWGINTPVPKSKLHSAVSGLASRFPLLIIFIVVIFSVKRMNVCPILIYRQKKFS